MQAKLNATTIKALEPAPKPFEVVDTELKGFLLRVQPSGKKTYYYSYRATSGNRKRIKLGTVTEMSPAQARDEATKRAGEVAAGIDVQLEKLSARHSAQEARLRTLGKFIEVHYRPWAFENLKTAEGTLARVRHHFGDFMPLALEEITPRRVEQWRTAALRRGLSPATINRTVNCLRGILTKAVVWELLASHPLGKLKPLKIDRTPKVRYLSESEEIRLLTALSERDEKIRDARRNGNLHRQSRGCPLLPDLSHVKYVDRLTPMVLISLNTGLRQGELFDLRVADVDRTARTITVRGSDAKSGHTRHVPLNPVAYEAITSWLDERPDSIRTEPLVFPADGGGRLDNVRSSWAGVLAIAGIDKFRWHDMRHDFASKLVMRGAPLNTVRELCGHADLNTTLRYAHLADSHKADAVALLA